MIVPFVFTMAQYREVPYLWFFYKWLGECKKYGWPMIAHEDYFKDPSYFIKLGLREAYDTEITFKRDEYLPPKNRDIKKIKQYPIAQSLLDKLTQEKGTYYDTFCCLLTEPYPPLVNLISQYISQIEQRHQEKIEAFITLQHNPSLSAAAQEKGIPVIHVEWGPFRQPTYVKTMYWDLQNLNNSDTLAKRYQKFCKELSSTHLPILDKHKILSLMLLPEKQNILNSLDTKPTYDVGVALGYVIDELHMCQRFLTDSELIQRAIKQFGRKNVILRKHPGDPYGAQYPLYRDCMQTEGSTIDFILSCKSIATLASNVAVEAMYYGRSAFVFQNCPVFYPSAHSFQASPKCADDQFLNFFTFSYLVPFSKMTDLGYIRWRLSDPNEREIYLKHLETYANQKGKTLSEIISG